MLLRRRPRPAHRPAACSRLRPASRAALVSMPQEAEARRVSPRVEKPGAGTPHGNPLPCMFSGICPCSPCDRASPGASVSTLGSMTRRQRAGMGCRCRSGSPAPEHGQHRFNSGRKREGVTSVPAHPPGRWSCQAGLRSPVRSRSFRELFLSCLREIPAT